MYKHFKEFYFLRDKVNLMRFIIRWSSLSKRESSPSRINLSRYVDIVVV